MSAFDTLPFGRRVRSPSIRAIEDALQPELDSAARIPPIALIPLPDVSAEVHGEPVDYAPPHVRETPASPLPSYVEHAADVQHAGRLTAEAMVMQYEEAAKELDAMKEEMVRAAKRHDEVRADMNDAIEEISQTAQRYRDKAKLHFEQIEESSKIVAEVRETARVMRDRLETIPTI